MDRTKHYVGSSLQVPPVTYTMEANTVGCAAATDEMTIIGKAPFALRVMSVKYIPEAAVTGLTIATAARTYTVYNRGHSTATGAGTIAVATRTNASGTNLIASVPFELTLATDANRLLAKGDVLAFESLHITTGVLDPGGRIEVTYAKVA